MAHPARPDAYDPEAFFGVPGTIYVMVRDHFLPGCVKIGLTTRSVAERVADANRVAAKTERKFGIADYRCIFHLETVDCGRVEHEIHSRLAASRRSGNANGRPLGGQEWFEVERQRAIETVRQVVAAFEAPLAAPVGVIAVTAADLEAHEAMLRQIEAEVAQAGLRWGKPFK